MVVSCFHHSVYYHNSIVVYIRSFFVVLHVYSLFVFVNGGISRGEGGLFSSWFVYFRSSLFGLLQVSRPAPVLFCLRVWVSRAYLFYFLSIDVLETCSSSF